MPQLTLSTIRIFTLVFAGMLAASPALADKPSWAGGDKPGKLSTSMVVDAIDDLGKM